MLLGIGLRPAAVSRSVLMALMWAAEWHATEMTDRPVTAAIGDRAPFGAMERVEPERLREDRRLPETGPVPISVGAGDRCGHEAPPGSLLSRILDAGPAG